MYICLICQTTVTILNKGNFERHFWTVCRKYNTDSPLKSELRTDIFHTVEFTSRGEASLRVSHSVIKHKKSLQDGEMMKEAFVEAADSLFQDFKNKLEILSSLKALQLSQSTVTHSAVK